MINQKIEDHISNYQVTVDEVEEKTGIDFFGDLEDLLEDKLESEKVKWDYPK